MTERFATRLRRLREEKGMTIARLALSVGVSEGTIRHLEGDKVKSPSFALGLRLADQLSVDPYYLALGAGHSVSDRLESLERRVTKLEQRPEAPATGRR